MKLTKTSTVNNNRKPTPGNETLGLEIDTRYYEIDESNKTEEA